MLLTISVSRNSSAMWQATTPFTRRAGLLAALGVGLAWLPLPLAAAGLLGTIAFTLILLRPVWGLIALIPLIPFSPLVSAQVGGVGVGGMEGLLALILVAWTLRMAAGRQIVIPHPPLLLPWLLWLGVLLLSWLGALSLGAALTETIKWLEMLALYLFIAANVERRHLPWLVGAIVLAGTAQAALGLYQFLFRVGPEGFLLFGGRFLRAYGTFRQPNPYAGYLGLVLPLAYSLALWGLADHRPSIVAKPPYGADRRVSYSPHSTSYSSCNTHHVSRNTLRRLLISLPSLLVLGLMLAALYASQSRGAWIGFAVAVVAVSLARGGRTAVLFTLAIGGLTIVAAMGAFQLLPPTIIQRFTDVVSIASIPDIAIAEVTDANFAAIERLAHWGAALHMWRDHPWLGVGFGNYAAIYPAYAIGRWLDPLGHAHNYYLNLGAETGLAGLSTYGLFWLSIFALSWRSVRRSAGFQRAVAAGGLGILVHLSVHNIVDNLFVQGMYLHVSVVLGLLYIVYNASCVSQAKIDNPTHRN